MTLRDADSLVRTRVDETLAALDLRPEDEAAAKLARYYADVIDNSFGHCAGCTNPLCKRNETSGWAARWIGPLLLAALEQLGATPAARAKLKGGPPPNATQSRLTELRAASRR